MGGRRRACDASRRRTGREEVGKKPNIWATNKEPDVIETYRQLISSPNSMVSLILSALMEMSTDWRQCTMLGGALSHDLWQ